MNYNITTKKSLSDRLSTSDTTNVDLDDKIRNTEIERSTLMKFTFVDDGLVSWEEDKMTLSMSTGKNGTKNTTFLSYFSLLLNLVLLIKII